MNKYKDKLEIFAKNALEAVENAIKKASVQQDKHLLPQLQAVLQKIVQKSDYSVENLEELRSLTFWGNREGSGPDVSVFRMDVTAGSKANTLEYFVTKLIFEWEELLKEA